MCRAFAALNIRVSSLASCTSPTRSSAIFPLASLTFPFISLSISFFDFLKSLLFSGSLQFLIWSLISFCSFDILSRPGSVVIYFILVSDMCFCRTFDYILELFPFVLFLCCYVFAARRFLLNLLSISFLGLFILCKLSSFDFSCASFDDKFLSISVLFWQRKVYGPTIFLSLRMNPHWSGLPFSSDSR